MDSAHTEIDTRALPPHNTEIEAALIGAVLTNNRAYDKAWFVKAEHFFEDVHGRIWARIAALVDAGQPAEPVLLAAEFDDDPALKSVDGGQYLFQLASAVVNVSGAAGYARQIVEWAQKREAIDALADTTDDLHDWDKPFQTIANDIEVALDRIRGGNGYAQGLTSAGDGLREALNELDAARAGRATPAVPTGLIGLDRKIRLRAGRPVVVAGATAMGKSTLLRQIAHHAAREGFPVAYFSLEETAAEITMKMACAECDVGYANVDRAEYGAVSQADMDALLAEERRIAALPLYIDDRSGLTVADVKAECRRLRRQVKRVGLIVVDYLQLMQPSRTYAGNRNNEIGEITRGVMDIAKTFEAPILLGSQLSRESQRRGNRDHRPRLSDLRDSGAVEQDANTVLLLYREEYYVQRDEPAQAAFNDATDYQEAYQQWSNRLDAVKGLADIVVAKQRGGSTGVVKCRFDGPAMRFYDLANAAQEDLGV